MLRTCILLRRFPGPFIHPRTDLMKINGCGCIQGRTHASGKKVTKIEKYAFSKFFEFVQNYRVKLESTFPAAVHVYRIFMTGMKEFYGDMVEYVRISKLVRKSPESMSTLSLKEIELYHSMPQDIWKVAPLLLFSALPFTNYVVLPLVYFFPRQLMCPHFWTLQQRVEFASHYHQQRLYNFRPVFRHLQRQLTLIEDQSQKRVWRNALSLLGSGTHPKSEGIIECIPLFTGFPYHIWHLYPGHVTALLRMHGMHVGWKRRKRLEERAHIIHEMDKAIFRLGGPEAMSYDQLRRACFLRGLNPVNMKTEDIVEWLCNWLRVSKEVDGRSYSLLLHCPVLLAYNEPSNWSLLRY